MAGIDVGTFITSIKTAIYIKKGNETLADKSAAAVTDFWGSGKIIEDDTSAKNRLKKATLVSGLGATGNTQTFEYFDQDEADSEAGSPTREDFSITFADRYETAGPQRDLIDASIGDPFTIAIRERQDASKAKISVFFATLASKSRTMETGGARNSRTMGFARTSEIHEFDQS